MYTNVGFDKLFLCFFLSGSQQQVSSIKTTHLTFLSDTIMEQDFQFISTQM